MTNNEKVKKTIEIQILKKKKKFFLTFSFYK